MFPGTAFKLIHLQACLDSECVPMCCMIDDQILLATAFLQHLTDGQMLSQSATVDSSPTFSALPLHCFETCVISVNPVIEPKYLPMLVFGLGFVELWSWDFCTIRQVSV